MSKLQEVGMKIFLGLRSSLIFLLLILVLGLEICSLILVINESISKVDIIIALISHFIACAFFAYILSQIMASNYNESQLRVGVFFFVITFYLPVLGLVGLTLAIPLFIRRSFRLEEKKFPMSLNKMRDLSTTKTLELGVQPQSIHNLFRSRNPDKRLEAVFATLKLKDRDAVPLLRRALGDSVDDIRLLAYALLDRKEHRLSDRIQKKKQYFKTLASPISLHLYRGIANDYWELAHLGLVQGETQKYVLNTACEYIELGLKFYPKDSGLCFQYAKILLKLGKYQQAYEQFKKAENLGIEYKKLMTYYAEIAFYSRRFLEVKQIMNAFAHPTVYPQVSMVARFWKKDF